MKHKRKRTKNDIAMAYRIESLPGRVSKPFFYQTLLDFLDGEIAELPKGWKIIWLWRNSRKSKLRSDRLEKVVGESRDSFMILMRRRLQRDLDNLKPSRKRRKVRKRRKAKKRRSRKKPRRARKEHEK